MPHPFIHYQESAGSLRTQLGSFTPRVALILGSGLGDLAQEVDSPICIPYAQIPHFPCSTAILPDSWIWLGMWPPTWVHLCGKGYTIIALAPLVLGCLSQL